MKRALLLVSHLGSNSQKLCLSLSKNKNIQWVKDEINYNHPNVINSLIAREHKYSNTVGIFLNEINHNHQISHKFIYNMCDFIYFVRRPNFGVNVDYYAFRLRRIYEMIREVGGLFLTWDDLMNGKGKLIKDKFNLMEDIEFNDVNGKYVSKEAEKAYELLICRIKSI